MKKRSVLVLLLATLTIGSTVPAAAAPYGCGRNGGCGKNAGCGQNYMDNNGDGICDNFLDENGDGINDNCIGGGQGKDSNMNPNGKNTANSSTVNKNTIKKVQKRLNKIGYDCGTANGTMNAKTKKALRKFKKACGLKADAVIRASTLKALGLSNS